MLVALVAPVEAGGQWAVARFADPGRGQKLAAAFPEIERAFAAWVERVHAPGAVMGVVVDGELVWVKTAGISNVQDRAGVTPDTVFRIASMTKSFTALAILRLRDEGKLSLDDPVATHVPELANLNYPTTDAPVITIRHLLTHSEGFPEDNPWGDRQLAQPQSTMSTWMRQGIPFSTVPGTTFEYSNYGFAILGQVVERVSKQPYDRYVEQTILAPLGMTASTFEMTRIPKNRMAVGYRWEDDIWKEEPILAHGTFGAMGGLWTSARDLARYVAFHMSAWPPRDGEEVGPVKRSSVREMQQAWRSERASVARPAFDLPIELTASAYGYGLGVLQNCRFAHIVSHGGGLPGYGSLMMWLPEYGVGLIGMANLTYAGWRGLFTEAVAALAKTGALAPRVVQPSPALQEAKRDVSALVARWDADLASRIVADNLFLDQSAERRAARLREVADAHGKCSPDDGLSAENALRGSWRMSCERGWLNVAVTLAPTQPPRVQYLSVRPVMPPGAAMKSALEEARAQIAQRTVAWGSCRVGEPLAGDGERLTVVRVNCDRGDLAARVTIEPESGRLEEIALFPEGGNRCSP
jgi:CubicO group peptidase (beta-lactamase class C family)